MIAELITLIAAFPTGFLIAWFSRDELVDGRGWFWTLIATSFIIAVVFYILDKKYILLAAAFIAVVCGISLIKSYDKNWTA